MNVIAYVRYLMLILKAHRSRYHNLFKTIHRNAYRKIVEIGVYNGQHVLQMIQTGSIHHKRKNIYYYGFDLFEDLSGDLLQSESSKNPKSYYTVEQKLKKSGANIKLIKGNTKISLPQYIDSIGKVDLILIDGGHSEETIKSDWNNLKKIMGQNTAVIFDDYYLNDEPEVKGFGCKALLDNIDRDMFTVEILEPMDVFSTEWRKLGIKIAKVNMR